MVIDYVEDLGMKRAEQTYLNFVRIDKAESFDGFEGMMETMKECFLFDSHAWKKVKARLEE